MCCKIHQNEHQIYTLKIHRNDINYSILLLFQFSRKLDDLLAMLYNDREADTVQVAQEALAILKEKVDAIGKLGL